MQTWKEWYDQSINRGTSGDMVFGILNDWKNTDAQKDAEIERMKEQLRLANIDCFNQEAALREGKPEAGK
jgi:hypothetical protein